MNDEPWGEIMKTVSVCLMGLLIIVGLTGCEVTGPSVKVKGPEVKIPGVRVVDDHHGGRFCPPGQAKKGRC